MVLVPMPQIMVHKPALILGVIMDNQIYWFITVFKEFDKNYGIKGSRTWGFYRNKEDALNILKYNITDLWEYCYDYAVLEPYYEGISGYDFDTPREWFKYHKIVNSYLPIKYEPEEVKYYAGFAIG